jgi:hypothetical protein
VSVGTTGVVAGAEEDKVLDAVEVESEMAVEVGLEGGTLLDVRGVGCGMSGIEVLEAVTMDVGVLDDGEAEPPAERLLLSAFHSLSI